MKGRLAQRLHRVRDWRDDHYAIDPWSVRTHSLKAAEGLGYPVNPNLPLMDKPQSIRSVDDVFRRMLCINIAAACAFGFDREQGKQWLVQEGAIEALSRTEREFLDSGEGDSDPFKSAIEGLWALCWSLGLVKRFSFALECDDDFVYVFPNIAVLESSARMRAKVKPRAMSAVFQQLDLAYCLHWAMRDASIAGRRIPGDVPPVVVEERRRAFEWLFSSEEWDKISLDT